MRGGLGALTVALALAVGAGLGMYGWRPVFASQKAGSAIQSPAKEPGHPPAQRPAPAFKRNASGETYGSDLYSASPNTEPDLIAAVGTGGKSGYVRAADVFGAQPKTPQQAVAYDRKHTKSRAVPLYASNGKTVIGTFVIGPAVR